MRRIQTLSFWMLLILGCGQLVTPEPNSTTSIQQDIATPTQTILVIPTVTARATSTPRPATPEPTPTATPTPTPILYIVQSGDTLTRISSLFGVSTEAIQAANGIIDPRSLQIDQTLIIPNAQDNDEIEFTPTPTPFPVTVSGVNFIETSQDTLWAFGEVQNPGSTTLSEMVVEVNLYDALGKLLASKAVFTQLDILPPGQTVPFAILFEDPPSSFAQYQVAAISAVPIVGQSRYYLDLSPIETSATQVDQATYRISGQLENIGTENAEGIKLVVVAYDEANNILAQRQATLPAVILRSHARTPFEIDLTVPGATIKRYVVQAQALRVP